MSNIIEWLERVSLEEGYYTVNQLIEYVKGKPTITVKLSELKWVLTDTKLNKKRVAKAVIEGFPIIVKKTKDGRLAILDGHHRTTKALQENHTTIKAVLITEADLVKLKKQNKDTPW